MTELKDKLKKGEVQVCHSHVWLVIKWMDKKEVYMITTVHKLRFTATGKKTLENEGRYHKTKLYSRIQSKYGWYRQYRPETFFDRNN